MDRAGMRLALAQRVAAVGRRQDAIAVGDQAVADNVAHDRIVVDEQDRSPVRLRHVFPPAAARFSPGPNGPHRPKPRGTTTLTGRPGRHPLADYSTTPRRMDM